MDKASQTVRVFAGVAIPVATILAFILTINAMRETAGQQAGQQDSYAAKLAVLVNAVVPPRTNNIPPQNNQPGNNQAFNNQANNQPTGNAPANNTTGGNVTTNNAIGNNQPPSNQPGAQPGNQPGNQPFSNQPGTAPGTTPGVPPFTPGTGPGSRPGTAGQTPLATLIGEGFVGARPGTLQVLLSALGGFFAGVGSTISGLALAWQRILDLDFMRGAGRLANNFILPLATLLQLGNILASLASVFPALLQLILDPLSFLQGVRKRPWGSVYNSLTKLPVPLAIVRLYRGDGRLVATKVTDITGRYIILNIESGPHKLVVQKANYTYPSKLLAGTKRDEPFTNLYYGGGVEIKEKSFIAPDIPIDPAQDTISIKKATRRHNINSSRKFIAYGGLGLSVVCLALSRTWLSVGLLGFNIVLFALFRKAIQKPAAKPWGYVYDSLTTAKLPRAAVRIFDTVYNRLLETQISDRLGRFGFLVGKNDYRIDAAKTGYHFPGARRRGISDYVGGVIRQQQASAVITTNIPLEPGAKVLAAAAAPSAMQSSAPPKS